MCVRADGERGTQSRARAKGVSYSALLFAESQTQSLRLEEMPLCIAGKWRVRSLISQVSARLLVSASRAFVVVVVDALASFASASFAGDDSAATVSASSAFVVVVVDALASFVSASFAGDDSAATVSRSVGYVVVVVDAVVGLVSAMFAGDDSAATFSTSVGCVADVDTSGTVEMECDASGGPLSIVSHRSEFLADFEEYTSAVRGRPERIATFSWVAVSGSPALRLSCKPMFMVQYYDIPSCS